MRRKFWKHYRIFCYIMLTLILIFSIIFWLFLSSYEQGRSTYLAQSIVDCFNKNNYDDIAKEITKDKFTSYEYFVNYLKNNNYKNVSYEKKMGIYKDDKPVYSIKSDEKEIAIVTLKKADKKGLFNINRWLFDNVELLIEKNEISIAVPKNIEIFINGNKVDDTFLKDKEYYPANIKNIINQVEMDTLYEYVVPNIYVDSSITLSSGELINNGTDFIYKFNSNDDLLKELHDYLQDLCYSYTRYVSNEHTFSKVIPYLLTNTPTYKFLYGVKNTNIWSWNHTPTKFSNFELKNMQAFNENMFSVEATYDYEYYVEESDATRSYTADLTLLMVKKNGKWLLGDLTT